MQHNLNKIVILMPAYLGHDSKNYPRNNYMSKEIKYIAIQIVIQVCVQFIAAAC